MAEIVIYITILNSVGDGLRTPMCEDPIVAQNVADQLNGPDSHCEKGDRFGQWIIEEPDFVDCNGIGRRLKVENGDGVMTEVCVEDAYCFYGNDMSISFLDKIPKEVFNKITKLEIVNEH